jgi:hypothetical protein
VPRSGRDDQSALAPPSRAGSGPRQGAGGDAPAAEAVASLRELRTFNTSCTIEIKPVPFSRSATVPARREVEKEASPRFAVPIEHQRSRHQRTPVPILVWGEGPVNRKYPAAVVLVWAPMTKHAHVMLRHPAYRATPRPSHHLLPRPVPLPRRLVAVALIRRACRGRESPPAESGRERCQRDRIRTSRPGSLARRGGGGRAPRG